MYKLETPNSESHACKSGEWGFNNPPPPSGNQAEEKEGRIAEKEENRSKKWEKKEPWLGLLKQRRPKMTYPGVVH